ncbi:hypothetical protein [Luteolibacter soli]|uniref:Uncharacterized protein n=1 Tax=Luteolibacter soli TaxID=3135280 RepID=A0ABU9B554_9BACT
MASTVFDLFSSIPAARSVGLPACRQMTTTTTMLDAMPVGVGVGIEIVGSTAGVQRRRGAAAHRTVIEAFRPFR